MIFTSTIAAISTPPAKGGVAIIRISGDAALDVATKIFKPRGKRTLSKECARLAIFGDIYLDNKIIDDGLATYFPAPHSFTGEDTVEISCHGGVLVSRMVLRAALLAGASSAQAGEFTRRAFVNGRMSLTEAESVGMLLDAKSEEQVMLHSTKSRRLLADRLLDISDTLTSLLSSVFARIDYPDEDLGELSHEEIRQAIISALDKIHTLLNTYKTGAAISLGISTVICGAANSGKSTLYNLLSGGDYAIVTDIAGTTRDLLCQEVSIGGVMLRLCDTAGIREGEGVDTVEKIGVERALEALHGAELILALFDKDKLCDKESLDLTHRIGSAGGTKIAVITKCDEGERPNLPSEIEGTFPHILYVSAKARPDDSRALICDKISELFTDDKIRIGEDAIISDERQHASLTSAAESLTQGILAIDACEPEEIIAANIENALAEVASLDGRAVSEAVVADIFKKFCVGK